MVDFGVLRTLPCVLLLTEWFTLLISFVAMATQHDLTHSSSFQYLLAMGIITFALVTALLVGYVFGLFNISAFTETCLYALASLLLFIGFVAAVIACQRDGSPCKTAGSTHANVSMAFAFFAFLELLASAWLAWSAHSSGGGAAAYSSEGGYA
jgi:F0F1-type ATP synthase assembly protein I